MNNNYICQFNSIKNTSKYLQCSIKTINRCLNNGNIYIPDMFKEYLNDIIILNNNYILPIEDIKLKQLNYINKYNIKNYIPNLKAGLKDLDINDKYKIISK